MDFNQNNVFGPNNVNINNFVKPKRSVDDGVKRQLKEKLEINEKVIIIASLGDSEAINFGYELKSYLDSQGYSVEGVNQAIWSTQLKGQNLFKNKNGHWELRIGSQL
ncbi:MAG: hypothetical protein HY005_02600 [Candidatus Staskawiczbacteria bacterium]|nr:hypothetical protein [Candidatus Staskawiczbacteria bacterium]MBI3337488.1 hypothetical protein [Candidatus Staskawiczbacteria bacterium]